MFHERKILLKELNLHWNNKDFDALGSFLSEDVELRSTNILRLFPDSNGRLRGKKTVLDYMKIARVKIPNYIVEFKEMKALEDSIIISTETKDRQFNFHVQYFFRSSNMIYLIKSDLAENI